LFESLLKENRRVVLGKNVKKLSQALTKLKTYLNIKEEHTRIGNINLSDVLSDVDNLKLEIPNSIKIIGKLRNTIGHNLVWKTELDNNQFEKLFYAVAFSCFHAVNCLYPNKELENTKSKN